MNDLVSQTADEFQAVLEKSCFVIVLTVFRSRCSTVSNFNTVRDPQNVTGK